MVSETPSLVPELDVADLDRSLAVYTHVFGFRCHFTRPEERFVYLVLERTHLMLVLAGSGRQFLDVPMEYPFGREVNFQIEVSNVDDLYASVQRSNLIIRVPLVQVDATVVEEPGQRRPPRQRVTDCGPAGPARAGAATGRPATPGAPPPRAFRSAQTRCRSSGGRPRMSASTRYIAAIRCSASVATGEPASRDRVRLHDRQPIRFENGGIEAIGQDVPDILRTLLAADVVVLEEAEIRAGNSKYALQFLDMVELESAAEQGKPSKHDNRITTE